MHHIEQRPQRGDRHELRVPCGRRGPPDAVPARLHLARCLTTRPLRLCRCCRQRTLCRCSGSLAAVEGVRVVAGVPYAAIPGIRPLELDLYLPARATAPVPVVVFLHGGGWRVGSRHSAGPAYTGGSPSPFERLAQAGSRSPASTTGSPARRSGRRSCTTPRRRSGGCEHEPTRSGSTQAASPPGVSPPVGTWPNCWV